MLLNLREMCWWCPSWAVLFIRHLLQIDKMMPSHKPTIKIRTVNFRLSAIDPHGVTIFSGLRADRQLNSCEIKANVRNLVNEKICHKSKRRRRNEKSDCANQFKLMTKNHHIPAQKKKKHNPHYYLFTK
jgi:hypothetical protein